MSATLLIDSLIILRELLAEERLALETHQSDLLQALAVKKITASARVESLFSKKEDLDALSEKERSEVKELGLAVEREARANAQIASGALAMSMAKLNFIAELSSDSYGPNGKPKNPMGRGSWEASA